LSFVYFLLLTLFTVRRFVTLNLCVIIRTGFSFSPLNSSNNNSNQIDYCYSGYEYFSYVNNNACSLHVEYAPVTGSAAYRLAIFCSIGLMMLLFFFA